MNCLTAKEVYIKTGMVRATFYPVVSIRLRGQVFDS